jgi:hypothetical protein
MVFTSRDASILLVARLAGLNWAEACNPPMAPPVVMPRFFILKVIAERVMVFCTGVKAVLDNIIISRGRINFFILLNNAFAGKIIYTGLFFTFR